MVFQDNFGHKGITEGSNTFLQQTFFQFFVAVFHVLKAPASFLFSSLFCRFLLLTVPAVNHKGNPTERNKNQGNDLSLFYHNPKAIASRGTAGLGQKLIALRKGLDY